MDFHMFHFKGVMSTFNTQTCIGVGVVTRISSFSWGEFSQSGD